MSPRPHCLKYLFLSFHSKIAIVFCGEVCFLEASNRRILCFVCLFFKIWLASLCPLTGELRAFIFNIIIKKYVLIFPFYWFCSVWVFLFLSCLPLSQLVFSSGSLEMCSYFFSSKDSLKCFLYSWLSGHDILYAIFIVKSFSFFFDLDIIMHIIMGWQFLCFRTWYALFHALKLFKFLLRNLLSFWWASLYTGLISLLLLSIFLFYIFSGLNVIMHVDVLFLSSLFGVLNISSIWAGFHFLKFGAFSVTILLKMFSMFLEWNSSSMHKIRGFGLFIVFYKVWKLCFYFLIVWILIPIFYLQIAFCHHLDLLGEALHTAFNLTSWGVFHFWYLSLIWF